MDDRPNFSALASAVRIARHVGAAITLGALSFGLGAASVALAGVPLPVVAETTGIPSLAAVVKRIAPSVVNIEGRARVAAVPATKRGQAGKGIALAAQNEIHSFGSGVVFDARRGLIITNSHVVDHAYEITVRLTDGRVLPGRRVGTDPETDVAVIQVRGDGLTELPFGISDRLVGGATERAGLKRDRTRRHAGTPALLRTGEIGTLTETAAGHRLQMMRGEPSRATIPRKSIGVPPFPCWLGPPSP